MEIILLGEDERSRHYNLPLCVQAQGLILGATGGRVYVPQCFVVPLSNRICPVLGVCKQHPYDNQHQYSQQSLLPTSHNEINSISPFFKYSYQSQLILFYFILSKQCFIVLIKSPPNPHLQYEPFYLLLVISKYKSIIFWQS